MFKKMDKIDILSTLIMTVLSLLVAMYIRVFIIHMRISNIEKTVTQIAEKMEVAK